jgi:DnaJ-class molecular chaperone
MKNCSTVLLVECPNCNGIGEIEFFASKWANKPDYMPCPTCKGTGEVSRLKSRAIQSGQNEMSRQLIESDNKRFGF